MERCKICNETNSGWTHHNGVHMCIDCAIRLAEEELQARLDLVKSPKDLEGWDPRDMVRAFMRVFVSYQKEPTYEKIETIACLYFWAVHAQGTVASTIYEIFKWQDFNLEAERKKNGLFKK